MFLGWALNLGMGGSGTAAPPVLVLFDIIVNRVYGLIWDTAVTDQQIYDSYQLDYGLPFPESNFLLTICLNTLELNRLISTEVISGVRFSVRL